MGFRLSFYNIPKTLADKVQTVKSDEELYSYEDDLKNEEMLYDTAYSLMPTFLGENGQYVSRLFDAKLRIEEDCFYGKMNKEQFKNLIELAVRNVMVTEKNFKEKYKDEEKVKEELARIREEINREIDSRINEELTIADELSKAANNIIILIENDIKACKALINRKDGYFYKNGCMSYKCFNKIIYTEYHYYNFFNNICYKNSHEKIPQINRNNNIDRISIVIFAVSGNILGTTLYDTIYHELEHIFQQTKANKVFTKSDMYDYVVRRKNEVEVSNPEYLICDSLYLTYNFERDAYINGAYGFLMHTCKSYMDVDKAIENTDLYQAIEMLKFYYSIIYKNRIKFIEALSSQKYRSYGITVNNLLKKIKQSINSYEDKLRKMKRKAKQDIAKRNGEHIMETKKYYSWDEIKEILIESFDKIV